jgi:hypothetical protein
VAHHREHSHEGPLVEPIQLLDVLARRTTLRSHFEEGTRDLREPLHLVLRYVALVVVVDRVERLELLDLELLVLFNSLLIALSLVEGEEVALGLLGGFNVALLLLMLRLDGVLRLEDVESLEVSDHRVVGLIDLVNR